MLLILDEAGISGKVREYIAVGFDGTGSFGRKLGTVGRVFVWKVRGRSLPRPLKDALSPRLKKEAVEGEKSTSAECRMLVTTTVAASVLVLAQHSAAAMLL